MQPDIADLLAFRAPYLEEKLVRLGVAPTHHAADALFTELKRYFVLSESLPGQVVPMFSTRVDEAWHQFALFTRQYADFCMRFIGRFVHHVPSEAPEAKQVVSALSFDAFSAHYRTAFAVEPAAWRDELALSGATRLRWSRWAAPLDVALAAGSAQLVQAGEPPRVLASVSARAGAALRFIATERLFLVRELPGLRTPGEQLALCRPLVQFGILRVAP
jgi:hypothetical protein